MSPGPIVAPDPAPYPTFSRISRLSPIPPPPQSAVSVFIAVRADATSLPKGIVSPMPAFRTPHTCSRHEPRGQQVGAASLSGASEGEGTKLSRLPSHAPRRGRAPSQPLSDLRTPFLHASRSRLVPRPPKTPSPACPLLPWPAHCPESGVPGAGRAGVCVQGAEPARCPSVSGQRWQTSSDAGPASLDTEAALFPGRGWGHQVTAGEEDLRQGADLRAPGCREGSSGGHGKPCPSSVPMCSPVIQHPFFLFRPYCSSQTDAPRLHPRAPHNLTTAFCNETHPADEETGVPTPPDLGRDPPPPPPPPPAEMVAAFICPSGRQGGGSCHWHPSPSEVSPCGGGGGGERPIRVDSGRRGGMGSGCT